MKKFALLILFAIMFSLYAYSENDSLAVGEQIAGEQQSIQPPVVTEIAPVAETTPVVADVVNANPIVNENKPEKVKNKKIHPNLEKHLDKDNFVGVIVQFEGKPGDELKKELKNNGCRVKYVPRHMNLVSVECPGRSLDSLSSSNNVKFVWEDEVLQTTLDVSASQISAPDAWASGYNGSGVNISVIDTGINTSHPALAGKVILEQDFTTDGNPNDACNHGTPVAGVIASNNDTYKGIAFGANLFNAKSAQNATCGHSSTDIIEAIDWSVANGAQLISMSIGSYTASGCDLSITANYVNQTVIEDNIPIVIGAGNNGPSDETINVPGCAENAITVGMVNDNNEIVETSSRGPAHYEDGTNWTKPDVVAPGAGIFSTDNNHGTFGSYDGTSISTPHVSGVIALMFQANPYLGQKDVRSILENTSMDLGYDVNTQGHGLVNASAAVALALTLNLTPSPPDVTDYPGVLIYYSSASPSTSPKFRDIFDDSTFSGENVTLGVTANAVWMESASSPVRDEEVLVTQDVGNKTVAQIHTKFGFSDVLNLSTSNGGTGARKFDVAYENSGRAIIVYGNNSGTPAYKIWNGSAYTESGVLGSSSCSNATAWVELVSKLGADQVIAAYQDVSGNYCGQVWNGSAWGSVIKFGQDTDTSAQKFDVAYEGSSGQALAVFETSTAGVVGYCAWNGTSWCSSASTLSDRGAQNDWLRLASQNASDRIVLGAFQIGDADIDVIEWNGTAFGTWKQIDSSVEGSGNRIMDVAYVGTSGKAMIVYDNNNDDVPSSATCANASACFAGTWSSTANTTSTSNNCGEASDLDYIGLVPDPQSDKVLLYALSQANHYKCAQFYDGTSWGAWNGNLSSGTALSSAEGIAAVFDRI